MIPSHANYKRYQKGKFEANLQGAYLRIWRPWIPLDLSVGTTSKPVVSIEIMLYYKVFRMWCVMIICNFYARRGDEKSWVHARNVTTFTLLLHVVFICCGFSARLVKTVFAGQQYHHYRGSWRKTAGRHNYLTGMKTARKHLQAESITHHRAQCFFARRPFGPLQLHTFILLVNS